MKKKTIRIPDKLFNRIKLGLQPTPNDYRIFKGGLFEFFRAAEDSIKEAERDTQNEKALQENGASLQ